MLTMFIALDKAEVAVSKLGRYCLRLYEAVRWWVMVGFCWIWMALEGTATVIDVGDPCVVERRFIGTSR